MTISASWAKTSVSFPLPSSPQLAPTIAFTIIAISQLSYSANGRKLHPKKGGKTPQSRELNPGTAITALILPYSYEKAKQKMQISSESGKKSNLNLRRFLGKIRITAERRFDHFVDKVLGLPGRTPHIQSPSAFFTSSVDGTCPFILTMPSTTTAGVVKMLYFIISVISSTFESLISRLLPLITRSTTLYASLHLAHQIGRAHV